MPRFEGSVNFKDASLNNATFKGARFGHMGERSEVTEEAKDIEDKVTLNFQNAHLTSACFQGAVFAPGPPCLLASVPGLGCACYSVTL